MADNQGIAVIRELRDYRPSHEEENSDADAF